MDDYTCQCDASDFYEKLSDFEEPVRLPSCLLTTMKPYSSRKSSTGPPSFFTLLVMGTLLAVESHRSSPTPAAKSCGRRRSNLNGNATTNEAASLQNRNVLELHIVDLLLKCSIEKRSKSTVLDLWPECFAFRHVLGLAHKLRFLGPVSASSPSGSNQRASPVSCGG
eukprot:4832785-Heterocapsa_arctica.AAC.1